jgi:poly(3-hydroxybutyrate) depolymerase
MDPQPLPPGPSQSANSRCPVDATTGDVACAHQSTTIGGRTVVYETPLGTPPEFGWPVVVMLQGSLVGPDLMWSAKAADALATFAMPQTLAIKALLDAGYAVITPEADANALAWDTNIPPWDLDWNPAPDNLFMLQLFSAMDAGDLGPLDHSRWYGTGVSSGGYMTSRLAIAYTSRFKALAIAAGSYATCGGPVCSIPDALPPNHPPTLFLHGGMDPLVPPSTMTPYHDKLAAMGIATQIVIDPQFTHGWIPATPAQLVRWFNQF